VEGGGLGGKRNGAWRVAGKVKSFFVNIFFWEPPFPTSANPHLHLGHASLAPHARQAPEANLPYPFHLPRDPPRYLRENPTGMTTTLPMRGTVLSPLLSSHKLGSRGVATRQLTRGRARAPSGGVRGVRVVAHGAGPGGGQHLNPDEMVAPSARPVGVAGAVMDGEAADDADAAGLATRAPAERKHVYVETYGCQMNVNDSEVE